MKELATEARVDRLADVLAFIEDELERGGCPAALRLPVAVAAEEVFVNIARHAYGPGGGGATVRIAADGDGATVEFEDGGTAYNPLEQPEPDVTLPAEERAIGGLGVFMAKRLMDLSYRRSGNRNVMTMTKRLPAPSGGPPKGRR